MDGMKRHASTGLIAILCAIAAQTTPLLAQTVTWWSKDFDAALTAAKDAPSEMVLLYCWQESDTCAAMFSGTMSDAKVGKKLGVLS